MGMFDDLIPSAPARMNFMPGAQIDFSDLIPTAIDFDGPEEEVRASIARLPPTEQSAALNTWADRRIARERNSGFRQLPQPQYGIPFVGGVLDEATAAIQSGLHGITNGAIGEPYDEALALTRARERAAAAENPALAAGGQLATGLATGGQLFRGIQPAQTTLGRIGQGVAIGVPTGFVEGYTRGEGNAGNRFESAVEGAKVVGVVGAALPGLATTASYVTSRTADALRPAYLRMRYGPEEAADEILATRIAREGSTPAQKRLDLQRGQSVDARLSSNSNATLPETIADTSDAMQRLTGSLYRQGGEPGNFIRNTIERRQRGPENLYAQQASATPDGQQARIMDAAERALLIRSSNSAYRTQRTIEREQAIEGRRLYNLARENSQPFDLQPIIDGMSLRMMQYPPPFASKLQRAINLFTQARADRTNRFTVDNIERFDASKKALDDMIETAQRQGSGNLVRELTRFKNELLDRVHENGANPYYLQARQAWGSAAENREAIELGRSALRENSEVSVDQFRELTQGQQQLFRLGFLDSMRNSLATRRPGNDATLLFQQNRVRELMNEIIPTSRGRNAVFADRGERFGNIVRREQRMGETRNKVLGNSATAQRLNDDQAFNGDALATMWNRMRASPSLFNVGVEAVGVGIQRVFGYRQDVAMSLARRLLETDPTTRNQILRRLRSRGGANRWQDFNRHLDQSALNTTVAVAGPVNEPRQLEYQR